jgi:23S rRNA maturation-related 3'-5' exoribonuclease YhaM
MKSKIVSFFLILGISALLTACSNENPDAAKLKNVDAVQAVAIANEWNYSNKKITSYVTPREVVFKSADDKIIKKIPLPEDKMMVAVAPYINRTHR